MKKPAFVAVLVFATLLSAAIIFLVMQIGIAASEDMPVVEIQRMDHTVRADSGRPEAVIYYDKPIVSGDSDAVAKINVYFDALYEGWLSGACRLNHYQPGSMDRFLDNFNDTKDALGSDVMTVVPLRYTVDAEVTYVDEKILSIRQIVFWSSGGPSGYTYFGSTFDLETGETVPFTRFSDVDADAFRNDLVKFILKNEMDSSTDKTRLIERVGPNPRHDFIYSFEDREWRFDEEYYYDGISICLTLNQINASGYVVKWNGKTGKAFKIFQIESGDYVHLPK